MHLAGLGWIESKPISTLIGKDKPHGKKQKEKSHYDPARMHFE